MYVNYQFVYIDKRYAFNFGLKQSIKCFSFANLAEILSVHILKKGNIQNFVLIVLHLSRCSLKGICLVEGSRICCECIVLLVRSLSIWSLYIYVVCWKFMGALLIVSSIDFQTIQPFSRIIIRFARQFYCFWLLLFWIRDSYNTYDWIAWFILDIFFIV